MGSQILRISPFASSRTLVVKPTSSISRFITRSSNPITCFNRGHCTHFLFKKPIGYCIVSSGGFCDLSVNPSRRGFRGGVVAMAASGPVQKSEDEWRAVLSPEQFRILRQKGTDLCGGENSAPVVHDFTEFYSFFSEREGKRQLILIMKYRHFNLVLVISRICYEVKGRNTRLKFEPYLTNMLQHLLVYANANRYPGTGIYDKFSEEGVYQCAGCGTPLYKSTTKFNSGCGWPAFFEGLPGAINRYPDPDGRRVEITCAACGGHLGHVFKGEGFRTPTDERHCVNSVSLKFTPGNSN